MPYIQTQYNTNSAGMLLSGQSFIQTNNIDPYIIITDRNSQDVNYPMMKQKGIVGALLEAGYLYDVAHIKVRYQQSRLRNQILEAIRENMPYGLYGTVRSRSIEEAREELYELSLIIRTYTPLLGLWMKLEFATARTTNDAILNEYYKQLVDIGLKGQLGIYVTRSQLNQITWSNHCDNWFLLLNEHVPTFDDIDQLLTPSFFDV